MDLRTKIEPTTGGWRVFTSVNGNGWWAVGVTFPLKAGAETVERAIVAASTR